MIISARRMVAFSAAAAALKLLLFWAAYSLVVATWQRQGLVSENFAVHSFRGGALAELTYFGSAFVANLVGIVTVTRVPLFRGLDALWIVVACGLTNGLMAVLLTAKLDAVPQAIALGFISTAALLFVPGMRATPPFPGSGCEDATSGRTPVRR